MLIYKKKKSDLSVFLLFKYTKRLRKSAVFCKKKVTLKKLSNKYIKFVKLNMHWEENEISFNLN